MRINTAGRNRLVLLTRRYAIKIPSLRSWRDFLFGLLNNQNEAATSREPGHCPVLFSCPGGWLIVMPRARILSDAEFAELDHAALPPRPERKPDSFGWLDGRLVAVDYGW